MLEAIQMNGVFVKRDLRTIEHARLVHVVPRECVERGAFVVFE